MSIARVFSIALMGLLKTDFLQSFFQPVDYFNTQNTISYVRLFVVFSFATLPEWDGLNEPKRLQLLYDKLRIEKVLRPLGLEMENFGKSQ